MAGFPDDGDDLVISMISEEPIIPSASTSTSILPSTSIFPSTSALNFPSSSNHKRKIGDDETREKRMRYDDFSSALEQQLTVIDSEKSLEVLKYIHSVRTDVVVKDYIDKILELNFFPTIPQQEEFEAIHNKKTVQLLTETCSADVVSLLMLFCQSRYFSNNMGDALKHRKSVLNVKASLHMPGFMRLPEDILVNMTSLKQSLAIQIQALLYEGSQFFQEHLLVECAHKIYIEIKGSVEDSILKAETSNHIDLHFVKAQIEFMKVFNMKDID
ncbi:unnamed protein product [Orchesella dallaii]|uniref:Uncharacterized protein n=1 Tax=Orchesella dallaii TaxID=48710 RepID=A0ABP1RUP9_9HEXA